MVCRQVWQWVNETCSISQQTGGLSWGCQTSYQRPVQTLQSSASRLILKQTWVDCSLLHSSETNFIFKTKRLISGYFVFQSDIDSRKNNVVDFLSNFIQLLYPLQSLQMKSGHFYCSDKIILAQYQSTGIITVKSV